MTRPSGWAGRLEWRGADQRFYLDGIGPLPGPITPLVESLASAAELLALYGYAKWVGNYAFPAKTYPGVGTRPVLVFEKAIFVWMTGVPVGCELQGVPVAAYEPIRRWVARHPTPCT